MSDDPRTTDETYDTGEGSGSLNRVARLGWDMGQVNKRLDSIDRQLEVIKGNIPLLDERYDSRYAPLGEFKLVRGVVFGMVGLILTGFVVAMIALVFGGGGS